MKKTILALLCVLIAKVPSALADDNELYLFKASIALPVTYVLQGAATDKVVTKTLTGNDIVNLSLGRPLTTKVNASTEILALAVAHVATDSRLVIFDKTGNGGSGAVTHVVGKLSSSDYDQAYGASGFTGQGIGQVSVTAAADFTANGFTAAFTLVGSASGSQPYVKGNPLQEDIYVIPKFTFKLVGVNGRVPFRYTTKVGKLDVVYNFNGTPLPETDNLSSDDGVVNVNGVVLKGTLSAGGAKLATLPTSAAP